MKEELEETEYATSEIVVAVGLVTEACKILLVIPEEAMVRLVEGLNEERRVAELLTSDAYMNNRDSIQSINEFYTEVLRFRRAIDRFTESRTLEF